MKFKPGQLVKLNDRAISIINPANNGYRTISNAEDLGTRELITIPSSAVCLIVSIDKTDYYWDNLCVLFEDILIRLDSESVELYQNGSA